MNKGAPEAGLIPQHSKLFYNWPNIVSSVKLNSHALSTISGPAYLATAGHRLFFSKTTEETA